MVHLSKMMLVVCIAIHKLLHFRYVLTTEIVENSIVNLLFKELLCMLLYCLLVFGNKESLSSKVLPSIKKVFKVVHIQLFIC